MDYLTIDECRKFLGLKNKRSVYEYIEKGLLVKTDKGITLESCYKAREIQKKNKKMGGKFDE